MRITWRCTLIFLFAIVSQNLLNPIMQRAKIDRSVRTALPVYDSVQREDQSHHVASNLYVTIAKDEQTKCQHYKKSLKFVFIYYFLIFVGLYGSWVFVNTSQCQCVKMI